MARNIEKVLFIVTCYPSPAEPTSGAFVMEIVHGFARQGVHCMVFQPVPWPRSCDRKGFPFHTVVNTASGGKVEVVRPAYWSLPIVAWGAKLGVFNPNLLKFQSFICSVEQELKKRMFSPHAVYGHFLYFGGGAAIDIGKRLNIPSFVGVGEGELWSVEPFGFKYAKAHLSCATGMIPNASHLSRKLARELDISEKTMRSYPNGVNLHEFRPINRGKARQELGLPQNAFIVCGVGSFLNKKGLNRVGQAIDGLNGVVGIFAGYGPEPPVGKQVLWAKRVPHDQLPVMLSACDVFVLPTLIEGCCNAIIEAMACGLPIVSSNSEYTEDLLNDTCALRVDPLDVGAIRAAIVTLRDNPEVRQRMASAALRHAQNFDIDVRAKHVLDFMRESYRK